MTMTSSAGKVVYRPDGRTKIFAVPFRFFQASDLKVERVNGLERTPVSGYTVQGVNAPGGGSITFTTAPAGASSLVIRRLTPHTQESAYPEGGRFPAATVENDFDRLAAQMQEFQDGLDLSVKAPLDGSLSPEEYAVSLFTARDQALAARDESATQRQLAQTARAGAEKALADTKAAGVQAVADTKAAGVQAMADTRAVAVQGAADLQSAANAGSLRLSTEAATYVNQAKNSATAAASSAATAKAAADMASAVVDIRPATATTLGLVMVGSNLKVDSKGTLSAPLATTTMAGQVKVGTGLTVDSAGLLSVPLATSTVAGQVKVGTGLSVDTAGLLKMANTPGTAKAANAIPLADSSGNLTSWTDALRAASTTVAGIVKLNNTSTSTSVTEAATANAVKTVADKVGSLVSGFSNFEVVTASKAWVAPKAGMVLAIVVAGGATGPTINIMDNGSGMALGAPGGNAGQIVHVYFTATAGASYTLVVGAANGNSSITVSGSTKTAYAGKGIPGSISGSRAGGRGGRGLAFYAPGTALVNGASGTASDGNPGGEGGAGYGAGGGGGGIRNHLSESSNGNGGAGAPGVVIMCY